MPMIVWKPWAPPKCKIFTWLNLQNRAWTAGRLGRRGWQNCRHCKLCNQVEESASHLIFKCHFLIHVWFDGTRKGIALSAPKNSSWFCPLLKGKTLARGENCSCTRSTVTESCHTHTPNPTTSTRHSAVRSDNRMYFLTEPVGSSRENSMHYYHRSCNIQMQIYVSCNPRG
jgi:hypothetical protein